MEKLRRRAPCELSAGERGRSRVSATVANASVTSARQMAHLVSIAIVSSVNASVTKARHMAHLVSIAIVSSVNASVTSARQMAHL